MFSLARTGSIGTSTIKVAEDLPDHIRLVGLAAGNNVELLLKQTLKHRPAAVSIGPTRQSAELQGHASGTSRQGLLRRRRADQARHDARGGHCA